MKGNKKAPLCLFATNIKEICDLLPLKSANIMTLEVTGFWVIKH